MNKQQTLEALEKARESHIAQMNKIDCILHNIKINKPTAVSQRECAFGKWLYSKDAHLESLIGEQFYNQLENLHSAWHRQYYKIYQLCFPEEKKVSLPSWLDRDRLMK
ncbi:MAG: CZB domain-containing protein [Sulfurospirillum sp.]|nr:CZB domain-containing protein [Sulfurospirillum sp.]